MNLQRKKKDFKYYIRVLISGVIALFLYALVAHIFFEGESFTSELQRFWYLPLFVTVFLFLYNTLTEYFYGIFDKHSEHQEFVVHMSKTVRKTLAFEAKDFIKLRESNSFQAALEDAYEIYKNGETSALNYTSVLNRFEEDTDIYKVVDVMLKETEVQRQRMQA